MISAPASTARSATSALLVSTEIGISNRFTIASITGTTRLDSSSIEYARAAGPCRFATEIENVRALGDKLFRLSNRVVDVAINPPSEKLSGVMFRIAITRFSQIDNSRRRCSARNFPYSVTRKSRSRSFV